MDSQTNQPANSEQQVEPAAEASQTTTSSEPPTPPTAKTADSIGIPVGKILLGILVLDAVWTLITSITPTIAIYQAALLANTNPVLVFFATVSSFVTLFVSSFFFNLFFALVASLVLGGGAFVLTVAFYSIFSRK